MAMSFDLLKLQSAGEFLRHQYALPRNITKLPLADEDYLQKWQGAEAAEVLTFLQDKLALPAKANSWENEAALKIFFAETLGGRLPVITVESHHDFCLLEAILNGRQILLDLPQTVNAFTLRAKAAAILDQRIILLNRAPYSNISASLLGLQEDEWLHKSQLIRLAHESTHYETLRLLGGMRNHPLDEIAADAMGQIAAFGDFSAERQRLFFGLQKGKDICTGRLSFYTKKLRPQEQAKVYSAVDRVLDDVAAEIAAWSKSKGPRVELLFSLTGKSIASRLQGEI